LTGRFYFPLYISAAAAAAAAAGELFERLLSMMLSATDRPTDSVNDDGFSKTLTVR
jgi:hypothetical protein